MALLIRRQILGAMVQDAHIGVPFDIIDLRVCCHQVVDDTEYEVLHLGIGEIKNDLCTATPQDNFPDWSFQYPFRMLLVQFTCRVGHFRLDPDTEFNTMLVGVGDQALDASW